jgi:hypothetical protein
VTAKASARVAAGGGLRCAGALVRRELGWPWLGALVGSAAFGAYVARGVVRAGLLAGDATAALRAPLLARLVDYPATLGTAAATAAALLAIVRVNEDRNAAWFAPLAVGGVAAAAYPIALVAALCAALLPIFVAGSAAFELVTGGSAALRDAPAALLLQAGVAAAACVAGAAYGAALAAAVRGVGAGALLAVALYAVPLVPALLVVNGGGEPGTALRLLALPLPTPSAAPDAGLLLRHTAYGALVLAVLVAAAARVYGRWPR